MVQNLKIVTRKADRKSCRVFGNVKYLNNEAEARVVNMSATGIALELKASIHAARGSKVRIESNEIGVLEGTIRWARDGRLGVQFMANSNSSALVAAYFRFFHRDIRPVLAR